MGYVQGFENDVFLSYAHVDDDPIIKGKSGWVAFFEELLRKRVRVRLGNDVSIFRDPQLRPFGQFSRQLEERLATSAAFVCVLSPRYVASDWCLWELEQFLRYAGPDRLIKIVKTAYDEDLLQSRARALLHGIHELLDCRFYTKDESSGLLRDLQPEIISDHIPQCIAKIDAIAQNLTELMRRLALGQAQAAHTIPATRTVVEPRYISSERIAVYLAETSKDLAAERDKIKSELLQFDYRVLPEHVLPVDADVIRTAVEDSLRQSKLSIHLIGQNYGTILDGEERSIPHLQYDIACAMREEGKLAQIVWMPNGLVPKEHTQQADFVKLVRDTSPDYLQTKLEDLKVEIRKQLAPASPDAWAGAEDGEPVNVCLLCHEEDMQAVSPLYSHLRLKESFRVKIPMREERSLELHKRILQSSDAVILYYGKGDEDWFVNVWRMIQRLSAIGRTRPILAQAIITGAPQTMEKDLLKSDDPMVLKIYGQFEANALAPFLTKIRLTRATGQESGG